MHDIPNIEGSGESAGYLQLLRLRLLRTSRRY